MGWSTRGPRLARRAEYEVNGAVVALLERRGWAPVVLPSPGYGNPEMLRIFARVVMAPAGHPRRTGTRDASPRAVPDGDSRRGWRAFLSAEVAGADVRAVVQGPDGPVEHRLATDDSGYLDCRLPNPGLPPGRQQVDLLVDGVPAAVAPVFVVDPSIDYGLISDIDDTVIRTLLPRPLTAAYNAFVMPERNRMPVPGMAGLYARLLRGHPGTPVIYVSTGAWNTAGALARFLRRHGFPEGAMLLTDWGPTSTGWFRSGPDHKRECLRTLAEDLPNVSWVLIGDDGQRDLALYSEFARARPDRVRALLIRELGLAERAAGRGAIQHLGPEVRPVPEVPLVRGTDGAALLLELHRRRMLPVPPPIAG